MRSFFISLFVALLNCTVAESVPLKAFQVVEAESFVKACEIENRVPLNLQGKTLPDWMLANIQEEVSKFQPFTVEEIEHLFATSWRLLFYFRIREGKVYVSCNMDGIFPPLTEYTGAILKLLKQPGCHIKTGDFLIDAADTAAEQRSELPLLCFSKYLSSNYILIPDGFAIWNERLDIMRAVDEALQKFSWESKIEKAFWIGAPNGPLLEDSSLWKTGPRCQLVFFSLDHPALAWARFCPFLDEERFCKEMIQARPYIYSERISQYEACKYKYLIDVDGWGAGFHRCQWVLRSDSVSIKQKGLNVQWYYPGLISYVHYVPYESDCSDLEEVIMWLKSHDEEARKIALNGRQFALDYINNDMIYLYLYQVLIHYNLLNLSIKQ